MKILYGVPSEGMGHATRSKVVITFLLSQGHDVKIVTSDRAFSYLSQAFGDRVLPIEGFHMAYKNAEINVGKTALLTLKKAPSQLIKNLKIYFKHLQNYKFDYVISDFESFTNFYAKWHNIPLLSIDNMQVINRASLDIEIPNSERTNFAIAKSIIKVKVPKANQYLITSFFTPPIRKKRTEYVPPIIRDAILKINPSIKNHIVVYQTSTSQQNLIASLQAIPNEKFYVFGFNREEKFGNVFLKKFSEDEFITLFASAKAVMANGGFSFISEAIYLHKPIYSVPIQNQMEQFINASYIQKLAYGVCENNFDANKIKIFLNNIKLFQNNINNYKQNGNEILFARLMEILK